MTDDRRALILVDHGSRQLGAHEHLEAICRAVQSAAPGWIVVAAHMELALPSLDDALGTCAKRGVHEVWVLPMFVVPGRHLTSDIPARIEAGVSRHPEMEVRVMSALGMIPDLPELIASALKTSAAA